MPNLIVHYDDRGKVTAIEHRPREDYEQLLESEDVRAILVDSDELIDALPESLRVEDGRLHKETAGADEAGDEAARRLREIVDIDKELLSDEEWFALFREYMTLTRAF